MTYTQAIEDIVKNIFNDYLPSFWESKESSNNYQIIKSFSATFSDFSAMMDSLYSQLSINTASGSYLDDIGLLFKLSREEGESDSTYRGRLKAYSQIFLNSGTSTGIKKALALMLDISESSIDVIDITDFKQQQFLANMETSESWTGTGVSADTTHYYQGSQGRKLTSSGSGTITAELVRSLDLEYNLPTSTDTFRVWCHFEDMSKVNNIQLIFEDSSNNIASNPLVVSDNIANNDFIEFAKSDFGAFIQNLGHIDDGGNALCVYSDGTYIYLANDSDGLRAYTFNGSAFTNVGHINDGHAKWIWSDGTYIYAALDTNGLKAYTFDGSTFHAVGSVNDGGAAEGIWGDGTYIYLANYTDGLRAYTFDGSTFTNVGHIDNGGYAFKVWGDGTYIYLANYTDGLRAYTFDGSTFTNVGHVSDSTYTFGVWGDGNYIYAADWDAGLKAYTFNGSSFTNVGNIDDGGNASDVWCDGTYVYLANDTDGFRVYDFNGSTFSNITHIDNGGNARRVFNDGSYIYLANFSDGLRAYNTFSSAIDWNNISKIRLAADFSAASSVTFDWLQFGVVQPTLKFNVDIYIGDTITDLNMFNKVSQVITTSKAAGTYFKSFDVKSKNNLFLINVSKINEEDKV